MKCTIVSIVPFPIHEVKPGLFPSEYKIDAAKEGTFETLVVDDATYFVYIDMERGSLKLRCMAEDLAESIVSDFRRSCLAVDEDSGPGMFFVREEKTKEQISRECAVLLIEARKRQISWFKRLVELADDDWEKTRQHKAISDLQRFAAKALRLERPWLIDLAKQVNTMSLICPSCVTSIHPDSVVCPNCRVVINPDKYKQLQYAVQ